jgi:restriction endonuclease S subunit
MPQISRISLKDIKTAGRIDAEYFKPEYLESLKKISSHEYVEFGSIIEILTDGKHGGVTFTESGVLFLRNTNIINGVVNLSDKLYISEEESNESKRAEVTTGDILLTTIGTIGECAVAPVEVKKANINQNLVKIRLKKGESSTFISTFLNSKFGKFQTKRMSSGNVQPLLNYPKIKKILVPLIPQSFLLQIEEIVKLAHAKQSQSKQLYKEAENLLLQELGLVNYEVKHKLSFSVSKSQVEVAHRVDSEYFQPKYAEIIKKIESYEGGWDFAGQIVSWKKGVEVGSDAYSETGKDFIRVSDFSVFGVTDSNRKISNEEYEYLKKNYQPKVGEILFTKDGSIGLSYVLKEEIEGILSGAFLRLSLKETYKNFETECLSLIFSSILCKMQVEKLSGGAIIAHLKPSDFETFKIPLINPAIQAQIASKIQESHKLRKESKELLEKAKRRVEEEIEK